MVRADQHWRCNIDASKPSVSPTTRYARAQCHKGEGVDRVLQEYEAAQVTGDIADERRDEGNHGNGQNKGPVAPVEP